MIFGCHPSEVMRVRHNTIATTPIVIMRKDILSRIVSNASCVAFCGSKAAMGSGDGSGMFNCIVFVSGLVKFFGPVEVIIYFLIDR